MNTTEILEKLLRSYSVYYDIQRENVTEPFAAEANFHTHDEQYFLVRSATISEAESNEYVYFANPYDDYHLYKMTHDGKNAEMLCGDVTSYINVYNDYIYYKRFNYNSR